MSRITIKDVAEAAGVSVATVSYALNGRGKVSEGVVRVVRETAARLGYIPNRAASALKTGRHRVIGCLMPTLANPLFPEFASAVQRRASELGYATLLLDTQDEPKTEARALVELADHGVDGVIAAFNGGYRDCAGLPFPLVSFDTPIEGMDSILCDHFGGGVRMAEYAAELGHRQLGYIGAPLSVYGAGQRREGFMAGALRLGLEVVWEEMASLSPQLPEPVHARIRARSATLIGCANDLVGIAALGLARDLGLEVPRDLSVIGFDDMQMAAWPVIGLSTLRQPLTEMGAAAVDLLLRRCTDPEHPPEHVVRPVSLVSRHSTSRL